MTWNDFAIMAGEYFSRNKEESRRNFVCVKDFHRWREAAIPTFTEKTMRTGDS